ncbi:MspA family porin [Rhodococcus maanshanensis]|uniref:MspA protein n=1 Tax=Rhodococcus maanshanensis TaxID=183556 RepID=A0A1H7Y6K1_9NOCA|nr:MspA family porin [Rhodococcus maanshanensis]SEM40957.1 MspA protein [Rhodococcus maanshanensis]
MNVSSTGLRRGLKTAALGSAAAIALGFFSAGAANADTFVPLPGGTITKTLADGTVVTVTMSGESANISGSMGATPLHRNVWVSGSAKVEISGGSGAEGGDIEPGYIVACQLTLGGGTGHNAGGGTTWANEDGDAKMTADSAGNISIGPGQAASFSVLDLEEADDFGGESHSGEHSFEGASGSVTWADSTMGVEGCAGYAQARSYVNVTVDTENVKGTVTLWGQPFSIG